MSVNVTDPKAARRLPFAAPNPLFLRDEELTRGIELLEQAHQALIAEPERALTGLALGRNHWRVLSCDRAPPRHHDGRAAGLGAVDQAEPLAAAQGAGGQGSDHPAARASAIAASACSS